MLINAPQNIDIVVGVIPCGVGFIIHNVWVEKWYVGAKKWIRDWVDIVQRICSKKEERNI